MRKSQLGEFEELVLLTIAALHEDAYGVAVKTEMENRLNRGISIGALQTAFKRLEDKGFISSYLGEPTQRRGGKRKRYYQISQMGVRTLQEIRDIRSQLWSAIPQVVFDLKK